MAYILSAVQSYTPASIWVAGSISIFDFTLSVPIYHSCTYLKWWVMVIKKIKDSFWYKRRIFIISRCQRNFKNALKWNSIFMFILEHLWNLISRTVQNQINHIKLILKKLKSSNFSNFWKFFLSRSVAYLYYFAIIEGNWIIFTF